MKTETQNPLIAIASAHSDVETAEKAVSALRAEADTIRNTISTAESTLATLRADDSGDILVTARGVGEQQAILEIGRGRLERIEKQIAAAEAEVRTAQAAKTREINTAFGVWLNYRRHKRLAQLCQRIGAVCAPQHRVGNIASEVKRMIHELANLDSVADVVQPQDRWETLQRRESELIEAAEWDAKRQATPLPANRAPGPVWYDLELGAFSEGAEIF